MPSISQKNFGDIRFLELQQFSESKNFGPLVVGGGGGGGGVHGGVSWPMDKYRDVAENFDCYIILIPLASHIGMTQHNIIF